VPDLGNSYRGGATTENPYPDERKGHLDYGLLKKLGLNKRRIMSGDAFFFYQLLFPLGDPRGNAIDKDTSEIDPRAPYYSEQKYAAEIGMGGSYGHQFTQPKVKDLVRFDMCLIRDGALNGSYGAIHERWNKKAEDQGMFCPKIAGSMSHTRFLKGTKKRPRRVRSSVQV
jgi:hypothetical protein